MTDAELEHLRYPIGRADLIDPLTPEARKTRIRIIEMAPGRLRTAVEDLSSDQLDTPYRPGGWTVRQVVHHLPDSHINAYVRFRLALTEDEPTIKPYLEQHWAMLPDAQAGPAGISLRLMDALHPRWVALLRNMDEAQFRRTLIHPVSGVLTLDKMLSLYAWHCEHHIAQINNLRNRMGWHGAATP
ncbi:MAG: bacillithiol transferase BstA [Bacteroidia bacterium]